MTFVSFAQNFEDVILWRCLKDIEKGFYIDVGAWSPDLDSVTKAFYERFWRGINIEPSPEFYAELVENRPRDINLCIAVGDTSGSAEMTLFKNSGLSTLDDSIARTHLAAGWTPQRMVVQVTTLADIWHQYVPARQEVHFLKIDVEGFEERVLRGGDWRHNRPWVVVVEATVPLEETEGYDAWEPILLEAGYLFVYADGLNRFYLACERSERLPAFRYPPNFFDHFRSYSLVSAEARVDDAEGRALRAEARTEWIQDQLNSVQARLEAFAGRVSAAEAAATYLKACILEKNDVVTITRQALAERDKELSEIQQALAERDRELSAARQALTERDSALGASQQALAERERELSAARRALAEKDKELSRNQQALAEEQSRLSSLRTERDVAQARVGQLDRSLHHWRSVAEHLDHQLQALYRSRSWRITGPYRFTGDLVRWLLRQLRTAAGKIGAAIESLFRSLLLAIMWAVYRRPRLKNWIKPYLELYAKTWETLALMARDAGFFTERSAAPAMRDRQNAGRDSPSARQTSAQFPGGEHARDLSARNAVPVWEEADSSLLSAPARRIYRNLKKSIESHGREVG